MEIDHIFEEKRLGRLPQRTDVRALLFSQFAKKAVKIPKATKYWRRKKPFPLRTFGNTRYGSCTRSKQAIASMRMERIESKRLPTITDEEVIRVYLEMTGRLYGGGDTGAYEIDALSEWRKPDLTFRDFKSRPLTIDAYVRLNPSNHEELKQAIFAAGAHGIAVCLGLPTAFRDIGHTRDWDVPEGENFTGPWQPYSWGGHSMWATDYDEVGIWLAHTWNIPDQRLTWKAAAAYLDEAHLVIDSLNYWRKHKPEAVAMLKLSEIKGAVNEVSDHKIT